MALLRSIRGDSILGRALMRGRLGVWLCALCLDLTILMAVGLLGLVAWHSVRFFWPHPLAEVTLHEGSTALGHVWDEEEGDWRNTRDGSLFRPFVEAEMQAQADIDFQWQ